MLRDWLEDEFTLSGKLPRTLVLLLARPGYLTREYLHGRIVRYLPPLRLYLSVSVVFFLLLSLSNTALKLQPGPDTNVAVVLGSDTLVAQRAGADTVRRDTSGTEMDSIGAVLRAAEARGDTLRFRTGNRAVDALLRARVRRIRAMPPQQVFREAMAHALEHAPTVMFALLPVFALLLKVLYVRRRRFYVEHFIFALHVHAFAFALFAAMLLLGKLPRTGVLRLGLGLWLFVYLFLAMRRVYGQGVWRTLAKYLLLGGSYFVAFTLAASFTFLVGLFLV